MIDLGKAVFGFDDIDDFCVCAIWSTFGVTIYLNSSSAVTDLALLSV